MTKKPAEESLIQIVETQAALRGCIDKARELTADSERLIRRNKGDAEVEVEVENPAKPPLI